MKPVLPLQYLQKALERLPNFDKHPSSTWNQIFSLRPNHIEFKWEKSEFFKTWVLVEVIMADTGPFETVKPFTVAVEVDDRTSCSIFDLLDIVENSGKKPSEADSQSPLTIEVKGAFTPPLYYTGQTDPESKP